VKDAYSILEEIVGTWSEKDSLEAKKKVKNMDKEDLKAQKYES